MTLVEIIIAATISAGVGAIVVWLLIAVAREQRLGFVEAQVAARADRIQDKIIETLRAGSRGNVVPFSLGDAVPGQTSGREVYYYRLIFRSADNAPNQEMRYDPIAHQLTYDPNRAVANDDYKFDSTLANSTLTRLEYVWFARGIRASGIPDSSLILVQFEVTDRGLARRSYRDSSSRTNWIIATRSFAVNLRQN
jgi:type II secretory pathway pseudopilin PulG